MTNFRQLIITLKKRLYCKIQKQQNQDISCYQVQKSTTMHTNNYSPINVFLKLYRILRGNE